MKISVILLLTLFVSNSSAQKINRTERTASCCILVYGVDFKGVIFEDAPPFCPTPQGHGALKKSHVTVRDALFAEEVLQKDQKELKNYVVKDAFIKANLKKYLRQYVGFTNEKGEKIILINLAWKKSINEEQTLLRKLPQIKIRNWKSEWYEVADGGNQHWMVIINTSTKTIIGYGVNGLG